jgi:hypothetical protein
MNDDEKCTGRGIEESRRANFSAEDKLRILKLADAYTTVGRLGTLLLA